MFNQGDYRMAKAQQERLLAQAEKQSGRVRRPNELVVLLNQLFGRGDGEKRNEEMAIGQQQPPPQELQEQPGLTV